MKKFLSFLFLIVVSLLMITGCQLGNDDPAGPSTENGNPLNPDIITGTRFFNGTFPSRTGSGTAKFFANKQGTASGANETAYLLKGKVIDGNTVFDISGVYDTEIEAFILSAGSNELIYQLSGVFDETTQTLSNAQTDILIKNNNTYTQISKTIAPVSSVEITESKSNSQVQGLPEKFWGDWKMPANEGGDFFRFLISEYSTIQIGAGHTTIGTYDLGYKPEIDIPASYISFQQNPDGSYDGIIYSLGLEHTMVYMKGRSSEATNGDFLGAQFTTAADKWQFATLDELNAAEGTFKPYDFPMTRITSSDFHSTHHAYTLNDTATLGLIGTSVSSSNQSVATAEIVSWDQSRIKITSASAGKTTITVSSSDGHTATIPVEITITGFIKPGAIIKYTVPPVDPYPIPNYIVGTWHATRGTMTGGIITLNANKTWTAILGIQSDSGTYTYDLETKEVEGKSINYPSGFNFNWIYFQDTQRLGNNDTDELEKQ